MKKVQGSEQMPQDVLWWMAVVDGCGWRKERTKCINEKALALSFNLIHVAILEF